MYLKTDRQIDICSGYGGLGGSASSLGGLYGYSPYSGRR